MSTHADTYARIRLTSLLVALRESYGQELVAYPMFDEQDSYIVIDVESPRDPELTGLAVFWLDSEHAYAPEMGAYNVRPIKQDRYGEFIPAIGDTFDTIDAKQVATHIFDSVMAH